MALTTRTLQLMNISDPIQKMEYVGHWQVRGARRARAGGWMGGAACSSGAGACCWWRPPLGHYI